MPMQSIRFLSGNKFKIREVKLILELKGIDVVPVDFKVHELQTVNVEELVRDKCLTAFGKASRPIFVEHTSLQIDALNGFPAGLTQVFWDTLEADRVAELFGGATDSGVKATTRIAYCDGRKVYQFEGSISGRIASEPKGDKSFQWDCIFIPDGFDETFAEMGDKKNEISMRKKAIEAFADFLKEKVE